MSFSLTTLGAGQQVGRSCVIVNINGTRIMFDCGVHMVFNDNRKFPDFRKAIPNKNETPLDRNIYANLLNTKDIDFNKEIDLVLISHFHLDHIGSLPYFTEVCNYNGPIIMTQPTKAIAPVILEDFRRIISDFKGEKSLISNDDIQKCLRKVDTIELYEDRIVKNIKTTCYYAGHVLGAAMFRIEVNGFSVVYTGDYNTLFDRHLNGAFLPRLNPDILITETTYGDTIRDTKRAREREFLKKVTEVLNKGGKVLIPTFALGRAQEICILLDIHWKRNKIDVPIFFFGAMSEKSNFYYKIFNNWQNETVKSIFLEHNIFNYENITSNNQSKQGEFYKKPNTPMVILATPGMLHAGASLNIFKEICEDEKNCVIIPGYCTAGTVGFKVLNGDKEVEIDRRIYKVNCEINYMSFSGHADAKGLMSLIKNANPRNLILVHGELQVMNTFKTTIDNILPSIKTYMPENLKEITFNDRIVYKQIGISGEFYKILSHIAYINRKRMNEEQMNVLSLKSNDLASSILNTCFRLTDKPNFVLKKFFKKGKSTKISNTLLIKHNIDSSYNIISLYIEYLKNFFPLQFEQYSNSVLNTKAEVSNDSGVIQIKWTSSSYEDKEDEIVSLKSGIESFVASMEKSITTTKIISN